mmetsp:Transcript_9241/g.18729  ORF Transcript_9241/g.18729 Transcript_9241/m.18729 type:complete len:209 (+) Transcript_9241:2075-2701(+)
MKLLHSGTFLVLYGEVVYIQLVSQAVQPVEHFGGQNSRAELGANVKLLLGIVAFLLKLDCGVKVDEPQPPVDPDHIHHLQVTVDYIILVHMLNAGAHCVHHVPYLINSWSFALVYCLQVPVSSKHDDAVLVVPEFFLQVVKGFFEYLSVILCNFDSVGQFAGLAREHLESVDNELRLESVFVPPLDLPFPLILLHHEFEDDLPLTIVV